MYLSGKGVEFVMSDKLTYETHPVHEIEKIRDELIGIRGRLSEIYRKDALWKYNLQHVEGGATCLIVALYESIEEMSKHQKKWYPKPEEKS